MKQIIGILKQLENTSGRIDKENILKQNKDNELLKKTLEYSLNPYKIFGIGKKSIKNISNAKSEYDLFSLLDHLIKNNGGADKEKLMVNQFISSQDEEDQEWYKRIILKDLRIGMQPKSINKVFKGLIPEFNCMLAENYFDYEEKLSAEFIATLKLDGSRVITIKEDGVIKFFTRQGQPILELVEVEEEAKQLPDNHVFDGEALLINKDNLTSKDLFRATQKVLRKDGAKKNIELYLFDMIPLEEFRAGKSAKGCLERKNELHDLLQELNLNYIKETEMLYVGDDKEEVIKLLNKVTQEDKEGIMINTANGKYQTKRTKDLLKVKKFQTCDLRCVGFEEGSGKYEGMLGRLNVEYKDNIVGVGSGFTDEDRQWIWSNKGKLMGKIVEIQYFEESSNQNGGISLRFPVFLGWREDKTEPSYS